MAEERDKDSQRTVLLGVLEHTKLNGWFPEINPFRIRYEDDRASIDDALRAERLSSAHGKYRLKLAGLHVCRPHDFAEEEIGRCAHLLPALRKIYRLDPGGKTIVDDLAAQLRRENPEKWAESNQLERALITLNETRIFDDLNTDLTGVPIAFVLSERVLDLKEAAIMEPLPKPSATHKPSPPVAQASSGIPRILHDARRIGNWVDVASELGQGGQGKVVLVVHSQTFERGALKQMSGKRALTDKGLERFLREIAAFRALQHPFIIRILDAGELPEPFLVTQMAAFGSLYDNRVAFQGDAWRCLRLVRSVALGLAAAHSANIIHRDIKPRNILLHSFEHPVVADFGIAHFADKESVTSIGSHPGAFKFAPPEYDHEVEPTVMFDIFSLGAVLHFAMTGAELSRPYRSMESLPSVSREERVAERLRLVDQLIAKMTEKEPSQRLRNMGEVVSAVDAVTEQLFGSALLGPNACACRSGSYRDLGAMVLGRGASLDIHPIDAHAEAGYGLGALSPRLEVCDACGTLRMKATTGVPTS